MKQTIIEGLFYDNEGNIYSYNDGYILKKQHLRQKQLWVKHKDKWLCTPTLILKSECIERRGKFVNHIDGNIYNNSIGNIEFINKRNICIVEGCINFCTGRGYCTKHYLRDRSGKDIYEDTIMDKRHPIVEGEILKIPLGVKAKGGYAIVDKEFSYIGEMKRIRNKNGYAVLTGQNPVYMHHMVIGNPPLGLVVDHIDRNKLNNCTSNLRITTHKVNANNKEHSEGKKYLIDGEEITAKQYSIENNICLSQAYKKLRVLSYLNHNQTILLLDTTDGQTTNATRDIGEDR